MTDTINNAIPFVPENTIDPAAGLNLSLNTIDALLQVLVQTVGTNSPPGSPANGARYIVGTSPTGVWAGHANKLARYLDGAWSFFDARYALNAADGAMWVRSGSTWAALSGGGGGGSGTVTSVSLSAPTGFAVSGSPVTTSGTLALAFAAGYSLPADTVQAQWSTAYGWGNHASAGYEKQLVAGANISIDRTNPATPVISASASSGMTNPMTTAGDLIKGGASGTPERLAVGTAGQVLTVVSGAPAWSDPAGGGAVSSVNGQTGAVVLDTDDVSEGASNKYFTENRVLATLMTGLTLIAGGAVSAADSLLVAIGKLQKQVNDLFSGKQDTLVSGTNIKTINGNSLLGSGDLAISGGSGALPVVQALTASRNLDLADINTFNVNSTTNNYTATIPPQSSVAWTADAEIHFLPSSTGDIVITAGAGVSLNGVVAGSVTLSLANGATIIKRIGSDSWWIGERLYDSGQLAWTAGGSLTITHNLGALPRAVTLEVVVTSTYLSTPAGTIFESPVVASSGTFYGMQVIDKTSSTIVIRCGAAMFRGLSSTSADLVPPANCQVRVKAVA